MNTVVVLVGVAGSGKTTQLVKSSQLHGVRILQPSTTRPARLNEGNEYHRVKQDEWNPADYEWTIVVNGHNYAMRRSELQRVVPGEIGLTVFHPGNLCVLHHYARSTDFEFVTIGLDTIENHDELRKRVRYDNLRDEGQTAFAAHRQAVCECEVVVRGDADTVFNALRAIFSALSSRGVLDKTTIRSLILTGTLLHDADINNVQPASYDLRVGRRVWCKGKTQELQANVPFAIPPYSYVIVEAREQADLPKFVVAHYDLRVSLFVQGVILSNGPQVDPGFKGGLLCMLFNGSDANVGLRLDEHFATIEFLVTSRVTEGYKEHHQSQETLPQFMQSSTAVGPGGTILDRLERVEGAWERFRNVYAAAGIAIVIALIVGIGALLRWGYDTWTKAEQSTQESTDSASKVGKLLGEERDLKRSVQDALRDLRGRRLPSADRSEPDSASSTEPGRAPVVVAPKPGDPSASSNTNQVRQAPNGKQQPTQSSRP